MKKYQEKENNLVKISLVKNKAITEGGGIDY